MSDHEVEKEVEQPHEYELEDGDFDDLYADDEDFINSEPGIFDMNTLAYKEPPKKAKEPGLQQRNYLFKVPKLKKISFGGGRTNRFNEWKWGFHEDDILLDKLKNRVKYTFVPDLTTKRSAFAYLINRGLDPSKFTMEYKDLDADRKGKTPPDLLIRYKDNPNHPLFSAGGYLLKDYTATDAKKERVLNTFINNFPSRQIRKDNKVKFSEVKKIYMGTKATKTTSQKVSNEIRDEVQKYT
jgi:hypothetical protein